MPYESVGQMITNISLMGAGMLFGIIGLVVAIGRGMSTSEKVWALTAASFAWIIALAIPNTTFAGGIFLMGALAMTFAFNPILQSLQGTDILVLAVLAGLINMSLLIGTGAFTTSLTWDTNLQSAQADIENVLGIEVGSYSDEYEATGGHGLCHSSDPNCDSSEPNPMLGGGGIDISVFDIFASILAFTAYLGKAVAFALSVVLAPIILSTVFLGGNGSSPAVVNTFIAYLIVIYITLWHLVILYKAIAFITNKYGMVNQ